MSRLFHFTSLERHRMIGEVGYIKPISYQYPDRDWSAYPDLFVDWCWLTDLANPTAKALGMAPKILKVQRMRYRYRVTCASDWEHGILPWTEARKDWPPGLVKSLESVEGTEPEHWFVADRPVPVILDRRTKTDRAVLQQREGATS